MLNGQADEVAFITLKMGTFIYGLDVLGYNLMSLATLFAAPVFVGGRLERWIRWSLVANGLLTPALLLQQNFPTSAIAALWAITFPVATVLLTCCAFQAQNEVIKRNLPQQTQIASKWHVQTTLHQLNRRPSFG
jgi:hypothetical protein